MFVTLKLVMKRLSEIIDVISAAPLKTRFTKCFDKQAEVEVNVRSVCEEEKQEDRVQFTVFFTDLPLLVHLTEQLLHVWQIFVLQEKQSTATDKLSIRFSWCL